MRVYSVRPPPPASRPRWAALLCLQLGDVAVLSLCAQYFLNVRGVGGITTLGALCVFSKRWTTACQSGSFVVFCGRTAIIDSSGVKFDPTHNLENFKIVGVTIMPHSPFSEEVPLLPVGLEWPAGQLYSADS